MANRASFLIVQAAKARRLAKNIPDEEASKRLLALAEEYEALANEENGDDESNDTLH